MKRRTTLVGAGLLVGSLLMVPVAGIACGLGHGYGYATDDDYGRRDYRGGVGTILGAVFGGILGSHLGSGHGRTAGIIGGTLLGAVVGHEVGESIDRTDELHAQRVLERNGTGEPATWVNPDTNTQVAVTPTRTYQSAAQESCREYTMDVRVGGEERTAHGTACRQPDGSWHVVN